MGLLDAPSFRLCLGVAMVVYGCWNSAMGMAFIKQSSNMAPHAGRPTQQRNAHGRRLHPV